MKFEEIWKNCPTQEISNMFNNFSTEKVSDEINENMDSREHNESVEAYNHEISSSRIDSENSRAIPLYFDQNKVNARSSEIELRTYCPPEFP